MFDGWDLLKVGVACFVVGMLFERLGMVLERRHNEKRGKVERKDEGR